MEMKPDLRTILKAAGITVLAYALSWVIAYDFTSLSFFSPLEKVSDFISTDFYTLVADARDVRRYEDRIAVVGVDGLNRQQLAGTLGKIAACEPAVTAIDLLLNERDESDSTLVNAMCSLGRVVYAEVDYGDNQPEYEPEAGQSLYASVPGAVAGIVNLDAMSVRSVIRSFIPRFRGVYDGKAVEYDAFGAAAVKEYSPEAYDALSERGGEVEQIYFPSVDFEFLSPDEIADNRELLAGKIVLVGTVDDWQDIHATPVDESMPGVLIHAYIASTILDGMYVTPVSKGWIWVVSFVLAFVFILTQLLVGDSKPGNMLVRWMQVLFLVLLVVIGTRLYLTRLVTLDLTLPLLMISLGLLASDIWSFAECVPALFVRFVSYSRMLCANVLAGCVKMMRK